LHPNLVAIFNADKKAIAFTTATALPVGIGIGGAGLYYLGLNPQYIATTLGMTSVYVATDSLSGWWRATQALDGEWNASMQMPKPQEEEAFQYVENMSMVPVPVSGPTPYR